MKRFAFMAAMAVIAGCNGSGGSSSSDEPAAITSDFNAVYEQLQESAPEMGAKKFRAPLMSHMSSIDAAIDPTIWANASNSFMGVSSAQTNPQGFVADLFDESVDQSIFERARMPFLISCCMDILAEKNGELFTPGSQTITFTSSVIGVCGSASDFTGMIGREMTIVVTDLADTSNYDQMIFFDHTTNADMFSDSDQWMYVRNNDNVLNFIHYEDNSAGFDGSSYQISTIAYDKMTQGGYFQHLSNESNGTKMYRILMDQDNDDARVFAYKFSVGSNEEVAVNVASTFENQDFAALSMSWANMMAPYDTDLPDGNACIETSDASIETDNTLTCAANAKTALTTTGVFAGIGAAAQALDGGVLRTDASSEGLADNLPSFTAGTILSAGIQL